MTTPDHVLINLEFANGALGQLLASFGTAATLAPWLEVHFPTATISFGGQSYEQDAPVSIYVDDDTPAAREGWPHGVEVPIDDVGVVETGRPPLHRRAATGDAEPVLTAEHARHVLDIIAQGVRLDRGRRDRTPPRRPSSSDHRYARSGSPTRKYVAIEPLPLTSTSPTRLELEPLAEPASRRPRSPGSVPGRRSTPSGWRG